MTMEAGTSRESVWDPLSESAEQDPVATQDWLREHHPVAYSDRWGGFWALTRYEDIVRVTDDPATFSSRQSTVPASRLPGDPPSRPLSIDPPEHTAFRAALAPYFAPRKIRSLEPAIREIAVELIDRALESGTVDAVSQITFELPVRVLCALLGLPREDGPQLKIWTNEMIEAGREGDAAAQRVATDKLLAHARRLVEQRRREGRDPATDITAGLIAEKVDGEYLSDDDIVGVLRLLFVAGHGTTTNSLGNAMMHLGQHQELQGMLREDPTMIPAVIEELLRAYSPSRALARIATRDTRIDGQDIEQGEVVALLWGAGNRDELAFDAPDEIIPGRQGPKHLAFGNGIHTCLGAPLARTELRVFLEELLSRTSLFEVLERPEPARWPHTGPRRLVVRFERAPESVAPTPSDEVVRAHTGRNDPIEAVVVGRREVAEGVVELTFAGLGSRATLERWEPGAHIDIELPDGSSRQYSLCGSPGWNGVWRVAVLREDAGRGGSVHVHEHLEPGAKVVLRGPRNHFALTAASEYVFVAGGIGVTPLLPMVEEVARRGIPWRMLYVGRERERMAYAADLSTYGDRVTVHPSRPSGRADVASFVRSIGDQGAVYCCGPEELVEAVRSAVPAVRGVSFHAERFTPLPIDESDGGLPTFEVDLARSARTVTVSEGESIVDACARVGVSIPTSCREGTCGSCESVVLSGTPAHRDSVLDDDDRATGRYIMPCVSRSRTARLELDL